MQLRGRGRRFGLYAIITLSVPMSLSLETTLRRLMFPPEFELVREFLAPSIAQWSATLILACAGFSVAGALVVRRVVASLVAERAALPDDAMAAFERRVDDQLLVLTSIPQIPAILATMTVMFGGPLSPAIACMALSSAAILTQALIIERALSQGEAARVAATRPSP